MVSLAIRGVSVCVCVCVSICKNMKHFSYASYEGMYVFVGICVYFVYWCGPLTAQGSFLFCLLNVKVRVRLRYSFRHSINSCINS